MSKVSAQIVADSISPQKHRLISLEIVLPRIILAELNTHRALSKNSASSRAIPFKRMVKMVFTDPFIPIAFQKEHTGMQGTEYYGEDELFSFTDGMEVIVSQLKDDKDEEYNKQLQTIFNRMYMSFMGERTLKEWWLLFRDMAVMCASMLYGFKVTKQLANRLLEPFIWHKVLITGTDEGWKNFFSLRCPQYYQELGVSGGKMLGRSFRSRKRILAHYKEMEEGKGSAYEMYNNFTELDWLQMNKGQAEIHMMALAEAIWDAMQDSKPKELQPGEWHIVYEDKIDRFSDQFISLDNDIVLPMTEVKIATGMAANVSYTTIGENKEKSYETFIGVHDKMIVANPFHASPFEHCAQVPTQEEYYKNVKGQVQYIDLAERSSTMIPLNTLGWFRNFHGWKSYRQIIEDSK